MPAHRTPTQEIDRDYEPPNLRRRFVAWLQRQGPGGDYKEDHLKLRGPVDLIVAVLLALFFIGSYLGFIAWLAATR